jgi:hypothetical protein
MNRLLRASACAVFAAVALPGGAYAADGDDDLKTLVAECGGPNVKMDDIDSCLERARVLGETSPSPELQGLTGRLERIAERGEDDEDLSKAYTVGQQPEPSAGGGTVAAPATAPSAPHGKLR